MKIAICNLYLSLAIAETSMMRKSKVLAADWTKVVNTFDLMPPDGLKLFNSFNPPSVNVNGIVAFRARSKGQQGQVAGIFWKDTLSNGSIEAMCLKHDENYLVPFPNNLQAEFNEFPSAPMMGEKKPYIATRGVTMPSWEWTDENDDKLTAGTAGVFVKLGDSDLITGAGQFGIVPDDSYFGLSHIYDVPLGYDSTEEDSGLAFGMFPGGPAVTDERFIVMKGNFVVPEVDENEDGVDDEQTGVYYRKLPELTTTPTATTTTLRSKANKARKLSSGDDATAVDDQIKLIANTFTLIPETSYNTCPSATTFGSTAPPSASGHHCVFLGLDNELDPTCGGIYEVDMDKAISLKPMAQIGMEVGEDGEVLAKIGEALSYDGDSILFWAVIGHFDEDDMISYNTKKVRIYCPTTGNQELKAVCESTSEGGNVEDGFYHLTDIPVDQGIFLYKDDHLYLVARTGEDYTDFDFYHYSGHVLENEDEDGHGPRFRSSAYLALYGKYMAFKARRATLEIASESEYDTEYIYTEVNDYIVLGKKSGDTIDLKHIVYTGQSATAFDDTAIDSSEKPLVVNEMAIERNGLRGNHITVALGFGPAPLNDLAVAADEGDDEEEEEEVDVAGIYIYDVENLLA